MDFFDGATKDGFCGVGMVIRMENSLSYKLRMDAGRGTNTKSELLVLWGLLYFSFQKKILDLYVLVDSKVIIDWALDKHNIHIVDMEH